MKIGLIGFPLSGKTTVFNLLTGSEEETPGFSAGRAETHRAHVPVPDLRVDRLSGIFQPRKTTRAEIDFLDLAGFVPGGGGLDSRILEDLRNLDALVHVLRDFATDEVPPDPASRGVFEDALAMETELVLTDLILVEQRLEKIRKDLQKGRKELQPELDLMEKLLNWLEGEQALRNLELGESEEALLKTYQFLSRVPVVLLLNHGEEPGEYGDLEDWCRAKGIALITMDSASEWEISRLPEDEREAFLRDLGVEEPATNRFLRTCYSLLELISFFTVGEDEVRAWTIASGLSAHRAAGKIHSDLERGFIRAETIAYDEFIRLGSLAEARKQGALRLEGKGYEVKDGDILNIRFNV